MGKFKEAHGETPDDLADLKDAGCCTGMAVSSKTGETDAALRRGFTKIAERDQMPGPFDMMEGGIVGRARGWER